MNPEEIKAIRVILGLTQENLARKIGVTCGTVNRWESGNVKPSPLAIQKLNQLKKEAK